ncbi:MAG: response regulator [Treponema sp.]|jgi:signal transduction histidine kinase/CheY-like chemotaxis protein/HAMP domain-containing protein|nr:response regulator [Treponema sp.]
MNKYIEAARKTIENLVNKTGFGLRTKLIIIFVIIKVIPLLLLTVMAWVQSVQLGKTLERHSREMAAEANSALEKTGEIAITDSINALNTSATNEIERISTDMAKHVAAFLYDRDRDILYAAGLAPSEELYRRFVQSKTGTLVQQREWVLSDDKKSWVPKEPLPQGTYSASGNRENDTSYRNRPPDLFPTEERPLYLEMTYVDLAGNEVVKVTSSSQMDRRLKNVAVRANTYVRAETYWADLGRLGPGEIYVSDVIGAYVKSRLIGMYSPENVEARGLPWQPEEEAYAGRENPNGKRFKGIIRWAAPVYQNGVKTGYVTLAMDHDHIMEFTDHVTPMAERYVEMPSAYEGNYAFIWDYKCRSICHPRHHSIVGYNPQTGDPEVPWLEESIYNAWRSSGKSYPEFIKDVPEFQDQSRNKKPAPELTAAGLVGLDGRYLNNAPQCIGWFDLTREGGSGSFLILWSGIWKPNTAATIPYYTGRYGNSKRGFGFVAIGAGLEDFQRPARETEAVLRNLTENTNLELSRSALKSRNTISKNLFKTTVSLAASAGLMIALVVVIAVWMASTLTRNITWLINGFSRFRAGERQFRFNAPTKDEIGELADSFDEMADSLNGAVKDPLTIINMDHNIIYMNEEALDTVHYSLEEIRGKPYGEVSLYPAGTPHDPIRALEEGKQAEVFYIPESGRYVRGSANWLLGKSGERTGIIIVTVDVTELIRVQKELEKAVYEANTANQHKGAFLARMSHEIRTPMNAIIGMTEIVKKKLAGNTELHSDLQKIEASSQHLLGLLNDILDISKIEAGKIELNMEPMDLLKLVKTVESIIRPRCEEKNIGFKTNFRLCPPAFFSGDPLRLRQVLINLLGNAVKFTPECGHIEYSVIEKEKKDGKTVIGFSVKDDGIGVKKEALPMLFKPFEQTSGNISKRYGGTGLGLAISQSIVQLFGGSIAVQSEEGKGSEFSFSVALKDTLPVDEETVLEDATDKLKGKRALLVDDVAINRMIAANLLSHTGLEIDEAENGKTALEMFSASPENTYDIIYMDIQMPVMDGYESAGAIRALPRNDAKTVPIIALTANAFKEDIEKAVSNGMNGHLAKPIEMDKCLELTFKLLRE